MIKCWFDGVCEPKNPGGHGAYGTHIQFGSDESLNRGVYVGQGDAISNNVAEYKGFISILEILIAGKRNREPIIIRGDSKLVIEQMSGRWRMRQGIYLPFAYEAQKLFKKFKKTALEWIPRDENMICDKLAKDVLRNKGIKFRIQPE